MSAPRPKRQGRGDRLLDPHATTQELACDYALGPFDRLIRETDVRWGIDRLPELVSPETARRWGVAVGALNDAIDAGDPKVVAEKVDVCLRGLRAMEAEAEKVNAPKASAVVVQYEGIGILLDDAFWHQAKEDHPKLRLYSLRQVAIALGKYDGEIAREAENVKRF